MTSNLRPDEQAAYSEIERAQSRDRGLKKGVKTAIGLGTAAGGLTSRILPFLSDHIPTDLALKGINKISPKLGSFLDRGMKAGLNIKEGLNFVKENLEPSNQKPAKDDRNIIQQYSDKLHEFLKNEISSGRMVLEAGARAQKNPEFRSVIEKLEKDHKTKFADILRSVFGQGEYSLPQQSQPMQNEGAQQPMQHNPQQGGQGQQALMAILQKIAAKRGQ